MKLIIIIPAYNEANTIVDVIKQIPQSFNGIDERKILVIDDGSIDPTVSRVKSETDAMVISHNQNRGVGAAFRSGVEFALKNRFDILVNLDADNQFNPLDIIRLVQPILNNEADMVTASRFIDNSYIPQMPAVKLWGNRQMAKLISWLIKKKFYDVSCGFRAYGSEALLNLNLFGQFTYTQETFLDLSFKDMRIKEIPVQVRYFPNRRSRVCPNVFVYGRNALNIILRTIRDYRPLKFFGLIGVLIFTIGLGLDIFVLDFYIRTGVFTPYKAVGFVGALLNIIGLAILFLGLLADMLFRIRMNQEKLLYFEKKKYYKNNKDL